MPAPPAQHRRAPWANSSDDANVVLVVKWMENQVTSTDGVSVLIVDDQATFRSTARAVVLLAEGFSVAAEAESGEDAVMAARAMRPDLVLMDINLPGINGIEATRQIVEQLPNTVVVLMSTYTAADLPADATDCGACSYVHKEDLFPDVLNDVWAQNG